MGFGRWWMKHGPGSAGSVAKRMAIAFSTIQKANPHLNKQELLLATLRTRYNSTEIDDSRAARMVSAAQGELTALTIQVIHLENPHAAGAQLRAPDVYAEMLDIILEVTEEHTAS